jgi:hypothetical protein
VCVCFFFFSSNLIFWVLPRVWLKPIIKTRNMLAADSLSTHTHYIFTGLSHPSVCVCVCVCTCLVLAFESGFPFQAELNTVSSNERHHHSSRPSQCGDRTTVVNRLSFFFPFFLSFLFFLPSLLCVCVCGGMEWIMHMTTESSNGFAGASRYLYIPEFRDPCCCESSQNVWNERGLMQKSLIHNLNQSRPDQQNQQDNITVIII